MQLLYMDESGDSALPADPAAPFVHSEYFVRAGVALHDKKWRAVDSRIRQFKAKRKIPLNVEIHATEIRTGKTQKNVKIEGVWKKKKAYNWFGRRYRDKESREKLLEQFLIDALSGNDITVFAVVIDKKKIDLGLSEKNPNRIPKLKSLELISERFTHHIENQIDKNGLIIMDSVNLEDDGYIRDFQNELYKRSPYISASCFIENILFCQSHTTNLLQLADVCSFAVYRKHAYGDDRYFKIIKNYLHLNEQGKIDGAGLKIWPTTPPSLKRKRASKQLAVV